MLQHLRLYFLLDNVLLEKGQANNLYMNLHSILLSHIHLSLHIHEQSFDMNQYNLYYIQIQHPFHIVHQGFCAYSLLIEFAV